MREEALILSQWKLIRFLVWEIILKVLNVDYVRGSYLKDPLGVHVEL